MDYPSLHSALTKMYPPERLLTNPAQLVPYKSDALTSYRVRPKAVVIPTTQEEVIETVRLCHRYPGALRGAGQRHQPVGRDRCPVAEGIVIA